jgi:hypothetical protein
VTASRPSTRRAGGRRPAALGLVLALALLGGGCAGGPSAPPLRALEPLPSMAAQLPDHADRAARDLAEAALAGNPDQVGHHLAAVARLDDERKAADRPPTGILPFAIDLRNATIPVARERREADRELLDRDDVDPALRTQVQQEVEDDPLRLASQRMRDAYWRRFARAVNALVEPIGESLTSAPLAPVRLGYSLVGLGLAEYEEDPLTLRERQALAEWKEFVDRNPDAPESVALIHRIDAAQARWYRTQRDHALHAARDAMREHAWAEALFEAERALRFSPEDEAATKVRDEARRRAAELERARNESLTAAPGDEAFAPEERPLAVALLEEHGDVTKAAQALLAKDPDGPFRDEARFALATAAWDAGQEDAAWRDLGKLADRGDARSNMARHARALVQSLDENPYRAFELARRQHLEQDARSLFLGGYANGPKDLDMPRPLTWLVQVPAMANSLFQFPTRLLTLPFAPKRRNVASVFARRYLRRHPDGVHAESVRSWLVGYEQGQGNAIAAFSVARKDPHADPSEVADLREAAAQQALDGSLKQKRLGTRIELLRLAAREFPGTRAGKEAGERWRREVASASPQDIRMTREFLLENPRIVGPDGLALAPGLLDGDPANGELHKDGVALLGGRWIELDFLGPSGRDSDPPIRRRQEISEERLSRVVSQLEACTMRTLLTDRDARFDPDANRDLFLERARLGVTKDVDEDPYARSAYVFQGMREKYGVVRSRESILPVELVVQGTFPSLGLGAFPRLRMPKPTPDAFLYR